jgi:hypothetical protein
MNLMLKEEWTTSPSQADGTYFTIFLECSQCLAARAQRGRGTQTAIGDLHYSSGDDKIDQPRLINCIICDAPYPQIF